MGLYSIECPQCKAPYYWFSGQGSADQRCPACKNPQQDKKEEKKMDYEQANLDSLNKVISVQNELIAFLKAEVERLKASQITINPVPSAPADQINPPYPYAPFPSPGYPYSPTGPGYPYTPVNPWGGPWIVTSSDTVTPPITGTSLPPGSIQSQVTCAHEMVKFGDAVSGGERCSKGCGFGSGWATSGTIDGLVTNSISSISTCETNNSEAVVKAIGTQR